MMPASYYIAIWLVVLFFGYLCPLLTMRFLRRGRGWEAGLLVFLASAYHCITRVSGLGPNSFASEGEILLCLVLLDIPVGLWAVAALRWVRAVVAHWRKRRGGVNFTSEHDDQHAR